MNARSIAGRFLTVGMLVALVFGPACGGGGGGDGGGGPWAGAWHMEEDCDSADPTCGEASTYDVVIQQNGDQVLVTLADGWYGGTVTGDTVVVDVPFSYPEDGGTTTVTSMTWTLTGTNTMTGTYDWSWTNGVGGCTGTCTVTGTR